MVRSLKAILFIALLAFSRCHEISSVAGLTRELMSPDIPTTATRAERLLTRNLQAVAETVDRHRDDPTDIPGDSMLIASVVLFIVACMIIWSYPERRQENERLAEMPLSQRLTYIFGLSHFVFPTTSLLARIVNFLVSIGIGLILALSSVVIVVRGLRKMIAPAQPRFSNTASLTGPGYRVQLCALNKCETLGTAGFDPSKPTILTVPATLTNIYDGKDMNISVTIPPRIVETLTCPYISIMYMTKDDENSNRRSNDFVGYGVSSRSEIRAIDGKDVLNAEIPFNHYWPTKGTLSSRNWCTESVVPIILTVSSSSLLSDREYKVVPEECARYLPVF